MSELLRSNPWTDVLDFWFGSKSSPNYLEPRSFWYGSPADDAYVRTQLKKTYDLAKQGKLDNWMDMDEGKGALALILVLDQAPRNMFRDQPEAYATDHKAVLIARHVVDHGWDRNMPTVERRYVYSPFNHSEKLEDQDLSLRLFTELGDEYHLHWATNYHEQIKRDGRFKHRDQILGR